MVLKDNFSLLRHVSITENTTKTNIKFKENDKVFFFKNHRKNGVRSNLTYGQPDSSKLTTS